MVNILPETEVRVSLLYIPGAKGEGYIVSKLRLRDSMFTIVHKQKVILIFYTV